MGNPSIFEVFIYFILGNKHNLKNQQSSMMYETSVLMDNQSQIYFQ